MRDKCAKRRLAAPASLQLMKVIDRGKWARCAPRRTRAHTSGQAGAPGAESVGAKQTVAPGRAKRIPRAQWPPGGRRRGELGAWSSRCVVASGCWAARARHTDGGGEQLGRSGGALGGRRAQSIRWPAASADNYHGPAAPLLCTCVRPAQVHNSASCALVRVAQTRPADVAERRRRASLLRSARGPHRSNKARAQAGRAR